MQASSQPTRSRSQPARSRRVSQPSADKKNAGLELQNKSLTQSVETLRGQLKDRNKDYRAAIRSKNGYKDQVLELRGAKPQEAAVSVIKTREHAGKRAPCTVEHIAHAAAVVHASGGQASHFPEIEQAWLETGFKPGQAELSPKPNPNPNPGQCPAVPHSAPHSAPECPRVPCSAPQCPALPCSAPQCPAVSPAVARSAPPCPAVPPCSAPQCPLQCPTVPRSAPQCPTVRRSAPQCPAVPPCSAPQCRYVHQGCGFWSGH